MRFEVVLAPEAVEDARRLKVSRSRIKRLRELSHPQYRLRVGDVRVFYDVVGSTVEVLAMVDKADASAWLVREGLA